MYPNCKNEHAYHACRPGLAYPFSPLNLRLLVLKTMFFEKYTKHRSLSVHIKLFKVVETGVHLIPRKKEKPRPITEGRKHTVI